MKFFIEIMATTLGFGFFLVSLISMIFGNDTQEDHLFKLVGGVLLFASGAIVLWLEAAMHKATSQGSPWKFVIPGRGMVGPK